MIRLTRGFVKKLLSQEEGEIEEILMAKPCLQILDLKKDSTLAIGFESSEETKLDSNNCNSTVALKENKSRDRDRYFVDLSDGESIFEGALLGSHLNHHLTADLNTGTGTDAIPIEPFGVVQINEIFCDFNNCLEPVVIIVGLDVKVRGSDIGTVLYNPSYFTASNTGKNAEVDYDQGDLNWDQNQENTMDTGNGGFFQTRLTNPNGKSQGGKGTLTDVKGSQELPKLVHFASDVPSWDNEDWFVSAVPSGASATKTGLSEFTADTVWEDEAGEVWW